MTAQTTATVLKGRGLIALSGPEAVAFLNGLVSNDVARARPGQAVAAALLTPQGKVLFDMLVYATPEGLLLECDAGEAAALTQTLTRYRLRAKVSIADASAQFAVVAGWDGPLPRLQGAMAVEDPRFATLGWRLVLERNQAESLLHAHGFRLGTEADYHSRRLALGVPEGPLDAPRNEAFLLDINAEELHMVDFRKGCYVGQELSARMKHRGTARRRILRAQFDGPVAPPGTPILDGTREIGQCLSGLEQQALALVRLDRWKEAANPLTADGTSLRLNYPAYPLILPEEPHP